MRDASDPTLPQELTKKPVPLGGLKQQKGNTL
jgi:hypothetical protein